MALSKKRATTSALVALVEYALANGYRVSEMPPYDAVTPGGHSRNSWHYDRDHGIGQACDINWGKPGASAEERRRITLLIPVAQSLGLAVIFALNGTNGPAAQHRDHGHFDVGSYSNLGRGGFVPARGDTCVVETQRRLHQAAKIRDNLLGSTTKTDLHVLREASKYGGHDFPEGVKHAQRVVGQPQDGSWSVADYRAHDETVEALQRVWAKFGLYSGKFDGIWGPLMERAYRAFLKKYAR